MRQPPDDDLPPSLEDALRALPREFPPPPAVEERTVQALAGRGLLGPSPGPRRWRRWPLQAAAAALLVVAGWLGGRRTSVSPIPASTSPRFVLLLYGADLPDSAGAAAREARVEEYATWARARHATGTVVGGDELADTAITLGPAKTGARDAGPNGYFIVEAPDLPGAVRLAETCPHLRHGGTVILRAIPDHRL